MALLLRQWGVPDFAGPPPEASTIERIARPGVGVAVQQSFASLPRTTATSATAPVAALIEARESETSAADLGWSLPAIDPFQGARQSIPHVFLPARKHRSSPTATAVQAVRESRGIPVTPLPPSPHCPAFRRPRLAAVEPEADGSLAVSSDDESDSLEYTQAAGAAAAAAAAAVAIAAPELPAPGSRTLRANGQAGLADSQSFLLPRRRPQVAGSASPRASRCGRMKQPPA